jgi:hypothetical protein
MKRPRSCSDGCACCPTGRGLLLAELEADEDGPYLLEAADFMAIGYVLSPAVMVAMVSLDTRTRHSG